MSYTSFAQLQVGSTSTSVVKPLDNMDGMQTLAICAKHSSNLLSSQGVILPADQAPVTSALNKEHLLLNTTCDPFADEFECMPNKSTPTHSNSNSFDLSDIDSDSTNVTSDEESGDRPFTLQHAGVIYTVRGVIGRGGYGEVLQADSDLGDQVAIKVCAKAKKGKSPESLGNMVMDELDVLLLTAKKEQPFLTQPLACFQDDNNVYFVMVSTFTRLSITS